MLKGIILEDISDIHRNAGVIEKFENVKIIDEYDGSIVIPEHTVNYLIKKEEEEVYILSINQKGLDQKLTGYRK